MRPSLVWFDLAKNYLSVWLKSGVFQRDSSIKASILKSMLKSFIYLLGTLALHFTNFSHASAFFSVFLPLIDALFLIFLCWQLLFFMTLNSGFSDGDHYHLQDLLVDIYDLRYDIEDQGLLRALFSLALNLFETICFFVAMFYYYGMVIDMVQL